MAEPVLRRGWVPALVPGPAQRRPPPGLCRGQDWPIAIFRKDTRITLTLIILSTTLKKQTLSEYSLPAAVRSVKLPLEASALRHNWKHQICRLQRWTYQSVSQREFRELHFQLNDLQILRHGPCDIIWLISFYHKMSGWNLCLCVL